MARVLVTTTPLTPHVRPTLPVVRELVAVGHEVMWYTGREFESLVTSAGAEFAPSAVAWAALPAGRREEQKNGVARLTGLVLELFLEPIPAFVADLEAVFDRFEPDVVVTDHSFRAGLFLAERRGVARVALSAGPLNLSSVDTAPFGTGRPPPSSVLGRLRNRGSYWWMRRMVGRDLQRAAERIRAELGLQPIGGYFIDWVARIADRYLEATIPEFEYPRSDLPASVRYIGLPLETGRARRAAAAPAGACLRRPAGGVRPAGRWRAVP
jgi:UDP:flavonoid glycosyltransferase YjiC (YdhE family)